MISICVWSKKHPENGASHYYALIKGIASQSFQKESEKSLRKFVSSHAKTGQEKPTFEGLKDE